MDPIAVRFIKLLGVLVVSGGLGAGLAQADQLTTTKNFVPAPNTPSYFLDESLPFGGRGEASSAASRRDAAAASVAPRSTESSLDRERRPAVQSPTGATRAEPRERRGAEQYAAPSRNKARTEAERDALRRWAEARRKAAQLPTPRKEMAGNKQGERDAKTRQNIAATRVAERPAALQPAAKPLAARGQQGVPKPPEPASPLPAKAEARPVAPETPPHRAGIGNSAPAHHATARDDWPYAESIFGAAAIPIALVVLGFLWQRRRPHAAALPGAATSSGFVREPAAADLNALLRGLEARIRRKLPRRIPFRLSLLPGLWPCHADEMAVAAAVIDLTGAAAADLSPDSSVVVGTRNFPIAADLAAEVPDAVPGDYVRLTLRENGRGLSETAFEQIFDPVATARPAIVRAGEVMRRLGGFIRVETAEGIGTAVHLYFRPVVARAPHNANSQ